MCMHHVDLQCMCVTHGDILCACMRRPNASNQNHSTYLTVFCTNALWLINAVYQACRFGGQDHILWVHMLIPAACFCTWRGDALLMWPMHLVDGYSMQQARLCSDMTWWIVVHVW